MEAIGRISGAATLAVGGAVVAREVVRSTRKTVAVTDATGPVGSLIVKALLKDGRFKVRAIVMDPAKYKSPIEGCSEVVPANYTDIFSINHSLLGADFAFLVHRVTDAMDVDQFKKNAKKLADAAKGARLQHSVWYTMEGADSLNGRSPTGLAMLEAEVSLARHVRDIGMPVTFIAGSFPFEFIMSAASRTVDQRSHLVSLPLSSATVPAVALSDVAKAAAEVFSNPAKFRKQTIYLSAEEHKMTAYTDKLAKVTGKHVVYNEVSGSVYSSATGAVRRWTADLCEVIVKHNEPFRLNRSTATPARKKLQTKLMTFEEWVKKNRKELFAEEGWEQLS